MFSELIKKLIKSQFASDDDSPEAQANELPPIAPQPVKSEFNDEWLAANLPRIDEATAMRAERQQPPQMPQNFALPEIEQTQALPDEAVVQTAPEMPTVAEVPEVPEVPATVNTPLILPELQSVETQRKINDIHDKDYSKAQYDEQGNITKEAGKDRDKDWSWKEKLGGVGLGLLNGVLSGRGLIGGIPEAIENGTNRNFSEQRRDNQQLGSLLPQLGQQQKQEEFQTGQGLKKAQVDNMAADNEHNRRRLEQDNTNKEADRKLKQGKQVLSQVTAQKAYKKGANSALDKQLADAEIEISDFDHTKKDITENGSRKRFNPTTGAYEQIAGTEIDPDEVPIKVKISGVETMMSVKEMNKMLFQQGMNAFNQGQNNARNVYSQGQQNVRQNDQQSFTAGQNEMTRTHQIKLKNLDNDIRKGLKDYDAAIKNQQLKAAAQIQENLKRLQIDLDNSEAEFKKGLGN